MKNSESLEKNLQKYAGIFNILTVCVFIAVIGYLAYRVYKISQYKPEITTQIIQLKEPKNPERMDSITKFSDPISINEPSGRADPLAPY